MRRITLGVAVATVLGLAIWAVGSRMTVKEAPPPVSTLGSAGVLRMHATPVKIPEFAFEDAAGQRRTLADFRGRYVLLNVWATWCTPCREEMPALDRLQSKLGGPHFEVLALSIDSGGAPAVKQFFGEVGVQGLAIYVDRSLHVYSALRVVGVPTTVLLDREGREIARHVGPAEWDGPQALQSIQRLMSGAGRE
jgi:thiol-disulfide isomerase/thioredoxin